MHDVWEVRTPVEGVEMLRRVRVRLRELAIAATGIWIVSVAQNDAERMVAVVDAWRKVDSIWQREHELPVIPDWLTEEQVAAIHGIYDRVPLEETRAQFFRRVKPCYGGFAGVIWQGVFLGIEKDGHTHS